jgi:hypothetical protein
MYAVLGDNTREDDNDDDLGVARRTRINRFELFLAVAVLAREEAEPSLAVPSGEFPLPPGLPPSNGVPNDLGTAFPDGTCFCGYIVTGDK